MISARWSSVSEAEPRAEAEAKSTSLVCRCPVPVCPCWPDSARPLSRKSLEMARCRGRWSDFWQTPDPPPACDTPMAWNYPAMIGRLPRCLRRGPQGKKRRDTPTSHSHTTSKGPCRGRRSPSVSQPARPFHRAPSLQDAVPSFLHAISDSLCRPHPDHLPT